MSRRGPAIREYFAAGLLGNVPTLFLTVLLSLLENPIMLGVRISVLATLLGGAALAAFLVSTIVQSSSIRRMIQVGLTTGIICYAIRLLFSFFLPLLAIEDYLEIAAFMLGGTLGSVLRTMKRRSIRTVRQ